MDVDRCLDDFDPDFKSTYTNASHSWLLNYPEGFKPDENDLKQGFSKDIFIRHPILRERKTGKRKTLIEAFYRKIISDEILGCLDAEEVIVEEYKTDYTENFKNPDDMLLPGETMSKNEKAQIENEKHPDVNKQTRSQHLKEKYPLYLSSPLSYVSQVTGRDHFRKKTTISKRPEENYDNIEY